MTATTTTDLYASLRVPTYRYAVPLPRINLGKQRTAGRQREHRVLWVLLPCGWRQWAAVVAAAQHAPALHRETLERVLYAASSGPGAMPQRLPATESERWQAVREALAWLAHELEREEKNRA